MAGKKDFTLRQLIAIADYFHVSLDSLLERDTSNIQINSLSDVCNLLFTLYERDVYKRQLLNVFPSDLK